MNINLNDYIKLSHETETKGLDLESAKTWIYPTNYPIRDYQYNIVQQALFKNTLVSLPTGLGKTFIAAVVMYNFFRWYPTGKIIFMAPTRPLVKQQVDACYDIMAIPKSVTAELTGTKLSGVRSEIWKDKRVFFITPQVLQNDLESKEFAIIGETIKCIVFDEAHKARGNYAYCEVIRKLGQISKYFRVLALSATPGNNVEDVQEIINNLQIAHLEFRIEESVDVHQYVFQRTLETIIVPLGDKLTEIRSRYIKILEIYTKVLIKHKIFHGNCSTLTKGRIFMTMKEYQQRNKGDRNYGEIMKSLNICVTLYHAFELLVRHGMRGFLSFFDEHINKPLLRGNQQIISIMEDVRNYLGPAPNIEPLPNGDYPEIPENTKFGHPKFYKLREVLVEHFTKSGNESRVIVFFEYRDSVLEAFALLLQAKPLIKPRIFLGQGSGITQRIQISVVKAFREGTCNTLLSTSIGEEGLDVGEVDLIVCFDISNKSPIRMVQRMGRTGRKKAGKIIVLVTEGKEQQTLNECLIHKNNIPNHVLTSPELNRAMYMDNPRMLPENHQPKCEQIYISVKKPDVNKNSTLKDLFRSVRSNKPEFPDDLILIPTKDRIRDTQMLFCQPNFECRNADSLIYRNIERQRNLQPNYRVSHSKNSKLLVNLLQIADSKRFNIPISQIPSSQSTAESKSLRQGDIRNFVGQKAKSVNPIAVNETANQNESEMSKFSELFNEISNFVTIQMSADRKCRLCNNLFKCPSPIKSKEVKSLVSIPDANILKNITADDLKDFCKKNFDSPDNLDTSMNDNMDEVFENSKIMSIFDNMEAVNKGNESFRNDVTVEEMMYANNFPETEKKELDQGKVGFEAPSNLNLILHKNDSSPVKETEQENIDLDEILRFFKLSSIEDMFPNLRSQSEETIIYSPETKNLFVAETPPKKTVRLKQDISPDLFDSASDDGQDFQEDLSSDYKSPILNMKSQTKTLNSSLFKSTPKEKIVVPVKKSPLKSARKQLNFVTIEDKSKETNQTNKDFSKIELDKQKSLNQTLIGKDFESPKKSFLNLELNSKKSLIQTFEEEIDFQSPSSSSSSNFEANKSRALNQTLQNKDFASSKKSSSNSDLDKPNSLNQTIRKTDFESPKKLFSNFNSSYPNSLNQTLREINFESPKKSSSNLELNSTKSLNRTFEEEIDFHFKDFASSKKSSSNLDLDKPNSLNQTIRNTDFESPKKLFSSSKSNSLNQTLREIDFESPEKSSSNFKSNSPKLFPKHFESLQTKTNSGNPKSLNESPEKLDEQDLSMLDDLNSLVDMSFFTKLSQGKAEKSPEKSSKNSPKIDNENNDSDSDITFVDENEFNLSSNVAVDLNTNILAVDSNDHSGDFQDLSNIASENIVQDSIDLLSQFRKKPNENNSDLDELDDFQLDDLQSICDISLLDPSIKNNKGDQPAIAEKSNCKIANKFESFKVPSPKVQNNSRQSLEKSNKIDNSQSQMSITQMLNVLDSKTPASFSKTPDRSKSDLKISEKSGNPETSHSLNVLKSLNENLNSSNFLTSSFSTPKHRKASKLSTNKNARSDFVIPRPRISETKAKVDTENPYGNISDISGLLDSSLKENERNSDEEFENPFNISQSPVFAKPKKKKLLKNKKPKASEFIDDEAELSEDTIEISDDEDETNMDHYETSFVADETQMINTQVQANYLKSIKSPLNNRGNFIIRNRRNNISNVFSQVVNNEDDTYMEDSFVVDEDDELNATQDHDLSELELLERKLKEQKRKRKQSKNRDINNEEEQEKSSKRRRIIVLSSDSE